jgi:NADPH:quinone reductase-like Zn-dependent oxidoreductase
LLKEYDDIAVYFRTEGISTIIITEKRDQEEEALRKNNSTNVIVFDKTSLPLKKAKETAIDLKGVLHTVGKVVAERIINLLGYAMKFTNSFGLTSNSEAKQSMTSKEELKAIHKRLLKKLGVNKQYYYGELLTVFRLNLSNLLKNYSVQGNLAHLYNFLAIKHLISLFHLYVKSKLTNRR